MLKKGKTLYVVLLLIFAAAALSFRPGMWLIHKPASRQSEHYVKGWEDGCLSGTNSYSLLFAPLLERPFVKDIDAAAPKTAEPAPAAHAAKSTVPPVNKDNYKTGWNEGFTLCRFYQSSVYELMQFTIVIATLLFIGYLLARTKSK